MTMTPPVRLHPRGVFGRPALLVALAAALAAAACAPRGVRPVSPDDVLVLVAAPDGPLLLDARSPEEYAEGHVPGAINVPFKQVRSRIGELEAWRTRGVVTYCEHGPRSWRAQSALADAGFQNLGQLEGNMSGWRKAGRPIEKGTP